MSASSRRVRAASFGEEALALSRLVRRVSLLSRSASCWAKTGARTASGTKMCSSWEAHSRSPSFFDAVSTCCSVPPNSGRSLSSLAVRKSSVAPESRFSAASSSSRLSTNGRTFSAEPAGGLRARIAFEAACTSAIARTVRRSRSTRLTGNPRFAIASLAFLQSPSAACVHRVRAARRSSALGPPEPPQPASAARIRIAAALEPVILSAFRCRSPHTGYPPDAHARLLRTADVTVPSGPQAIYACVIHQDARLTLEPYEFAAAERLTGALGVSSVLAQVLVRRGMADPAAARAFLAAADEHPLDAFGGLRAAAERILGHVRRHSRITVHGDYDVDGICASAVLIRALRTVGADVDWYLPSRSTDGYGLAAATVDRLAARGTDLLVTVDCAI